MSIKKTIITAIVGLTLVAVVAPLGNVAQADQLTDLLAQITSLQSQLTALQGGTSVQTPGNCTGVQFVRTLVIGSTGSDVKCLQTILNLSATTQVAITGAGSPGSETSYFGSLTLSAVRKYQVQHGWTPANQVGPMTRAALNAQIAGGVGIPPVVIVTSPVLCSNGNTLASNCTLLPSAQAGTICPNGMTLASNCTLLPSAQAGTATSTTGFIDVSTLAATPASNANVTTTSNVPVLGINVKAINANMTVNSLKVELAVLKTLANTAEHPATLVNQLYVYDGATLLGTFPVNTNTVYKSGTDYYVILSGFNFQVPANTTKVLTIKADFAPALESTRALTINLFDTSSVGAVDGTGATRTSGITTPRVYTVTYATVGSSTLVTTVSNDTPVSTSVNIDTTDGKIDVPMFVFDAKSTGGVSTITDIKITAIGTANDLAVAKINGVSLYDGSNLLSSGTLSSAVSGAYVTFSDLAIVVAKDSPTKTLTVKANFAAGVTNGSHVYLEIANPSTDIDFNTPNLSNSNPSATAAVVGNEIYLYTGKAAVLSFVSGIATYSPATLGDASSSVASGTIIFNIKGDGGALTKLDTTTVVMQYCTSAGICTTDNATDVMVTPNTATTPNGTIATVTAKASLTKNSLSGYYYFKVYSVAWDVEGTTATQTWGLEDFRTNSVNLY